MLHQDPVEKLLFQKCLPIHLDFKFNARWNGKFTGGVV